MQEQKSEINYLSDEDTQQRTGENTQYGSTTDRATLGLDITRRSLLKTTGAVGAAGLLGATTPVTAAETLTIDSMLDTSGSLQQALVVFESNAAVDHLRHLDLEKGYYKFNVLPIGYTLLTGDQIATVAGWSDVRYVEANHGIELLNDDARDVTGVDTIQDEYYYTGESVHVVVIDSGVDGDHPDLKENLQGHYRFVDPLDAESMWMDVGSADTASGGHGTHVTGSIAGNGSASDGRYRGMAPDADVSVYSTDAAAALLNVVGAYDDMLDKQRAGKHDVQLVNNSFGANIGGDYNPNGALETATWRAAELGILPVFAAGNSGPDTNTFSNYAAGPHLLAAAATDDDMNVTNFSSRGRSPDYSGQGEGSHWDRATAYRNLSDFYASDYDDQPKVGNISREGTVGPGAEDSTTGISAGESAYEKWTVPADAGYIEGTVSWTPQGEDIDVYLHEGAKDGPVVASGASLQNPEKLSGQVDGGTMYFLEIKPYTNVTATYTATLTARKALAKQPSGPYGIYRPSVGTPGDYVMSTLSENDAYQTYPTITEHPEKQGTEVWYGRLSGTSMASPVLCGISTLVYDAYYQNHGEFPDPLDVVKLVEATATDARTGHNTWNIGAGFADATTAVERAESGNLATFNEVNLAVDGEVTESIFHAQGTRVDDGSAFTAGQTNQVELTLDEATEAATVRDEIPWNWEVVGGDDHVVYTDDGHRYVEFTVEASDSDTLSYFIEAPSGADASGEYEFGPAEASPADGAGAFLTITETETNTVVGEGS
ncbi:S8 family serine peptidase [Haladaptatus pallidirubidus]|uniref:Peptidase S8/S53 domain-containing protein n=1 Tax=Haladaptatus pallidirubidus TaxID=1008152 RepID=A0AAV3UPF7_9EURY|nr:S8 family serine peptidase [Haladaptatus pallidirubidus]